MAPALFFCLLAAADCLAQPPAQDTAHCAADTTGLEHRRVEAIVDGDTLRLAGGETLRLIGINTPELGRDGGADQPLARAARAALAELAGAGGEVWLAEGVEARDRYGRRLAWVFNARGDSLSAGLLSQGLGFHVAIAPNHGRAACLAGVERRARNAGLGVWAEAAYRARAVAELTPGQGGFVLLEDRVTHVSFKDNGWWLQLGGKVGLHILPRDLALYSRAEIAGLEGRRVQARGWLVPMPGHWWKLTLGHPAMLEMSPLE